MTDDEIQELKELEALQAARRVAAPLPRAPDDVDVPPVVNLDPDGRREAANARVLRQRYLDELTMSQRANREAHQRWLSNHPYFEN